MSNSIKQSLNRKKKAFVVTMKKSLPNLLNDTNLLEEFDTTKKKKNWEAFPLTVIDREVYNKDK